MKIEMEKEDLERILTQELKKAQRNDLNFRVNFLKSPSEIEFARLDDYEEVMRRITSSLEAATGVDLTLERASELELLGLKVSSDPPSFPSTTTRQTPTE